MKSIELQVCDHDGLHLRPATELAVCSARFTSRVTLWARGLSADCKSLLGIVLLELGYGHAVRLEVEGVDEDEAYGEFCSLFDRPEGAALQRPEPRPAPEREVRPARPPRP